MDTPGIVRVIHRYFPEWEPPADNGREWIKALCPFHAESTPSAGVSYENDAFICHGCGMKGNVYGIIRKQESVTLAEAKRIAATISVGVDKGVSGGSAGKPGRRVFGQPGASGARSKLVRTGIRGRPSDWA